MEKEANKIIALLAGERRVTITTAIDTQLMQCVMDRTHEIEAPLRITMYVRPNGLMAFSNQEGK